VYALLAAESLELALLENAKQQDLHIGRKLPDLVEKQRATVRLLEFAEMPRGSARK